MPVFLANPGSMLVHTDDCQYAWASLEVEIVHDLADALHDGYEEARCCLSERPVRIGAASYELKKTVRAMMGGCVICKRQGRVEMAHIVPKRYGGTRRVPLCPNHHQAFDFGELSADDMRVLAKHCVKAFGMMAKEVWACHGAGRAIA